MSEASFASLGPTLLARKGGAKPAMRPQLAPLPGVVPPEADQLEDLGWNDLGLDDDDATETNDNIVSIVPNAEKSAERESVADAIDDRSGESPVIHSQQRRLAERILTDKAPKATKPKRSSARATQAASSSSGRRAAFTLRLDSERHLKLRLAATIEGVSAQALVTEALDALLAEIDDLDALAANMSEHMKRN